MDTNSKGNTQKEQSGKRRTFGFTSLGTLLVLLAFALISVGVYAPIKGHAISDDLGDYFGDRAFAHTLAHFTRYLYETGVQNRDVYNPQFTNLKNVNYYIEADDNTTVGNISKEAIEREIVESQFFLQAKIDAKGNPTVVKASPDFNRGSFVSILRGLSEANVRDQSILLSNVEVFFSVPNRLVSENDTLINNFKSSNMPKYLFLIFEIGAITIVLLAILAFGLPYSMQRQAGIVKAFNNSYLELKFLIWLAFFIPTFILGGFLHTATGVVNHSYGLNFIDMVADANEYFYILGIPITFALYLLIYLSSVNIKHIFYCGFTEGFLKKTLFYQMALGITKIADGTVKDIIDTGIDRQQTAKLAAFFGLNILMFFVIKIFGFLGRILVLVYTAFIFDYSKKILRNLVELNRASGVLSQGNFDVVLPEDMGMLSPFAKNLNNVKGVFMRAVEEETKSQNMKTQLITNVSHDLKTPLTSIITYVDLLKDSGIDDITREEYIEILEAKSKRLKDLIDDLFEVSKAASGDVELNIEEVDIVALLRQTLGEFEGKIGESTLQMRVDVPENGVISHLDGSKTYRVFENIIGNILKYSMPNTRVYIEVMEEGEQISTVFKNISSYEMNFEASEIVERFTRGDTSRTAEGSGLGLAIAKNLVELQGGIFRVEIDGDLFKVIVTFQKKAA